MVQDVRGHKMPYMEQWGSLEAGDPNRLGMYRLLIPDPTGTGTFADAGDVQGWNGSILVSIYPPLACDDGIETSAQIIPKHVMGLLP